MSSNVFEALRHAAGRLENAGLEDGAVACEWLLAERLGCSRAELPLMRTHALTESDLCFFEEGLRRLERGEPLAYILGHVWFFGRRMRVNPSVLVPRPETEQLVALVLECKELWGIDCPEVVDVGTGSGCIAITLALERPRVRLCAVDHDAAALETARHNAEQWGVQDRVKFLQGDLLGAFAPGSLHAVVANLPYIPTCDFESLDHSVRDFEPRLALDGGHDGLVLVRRLLKQATEALAPAGRLFLEIGFDQGPALLTLFTEGSWADVRVLPDLQGHDRFALATRAHTHYPDAMPVCPRR